MSRRRHGRHLKPVAAQPLIDLVDGLKAMNKRLSAQGFALKHTTRPYVRTDGLVTLQFVWRNREEGGSVIVTRRFAVMPVPAGETP